jgi:RNA polymerase sigma-70 factor (ECF subfamily)
MECKDAAAEHAAVQDLLLARRARRGDREAREVLAARLDCVRDQLGAAHARLGRPLGEHDLADVAADVLASLWSRLDRFDGRSPLEAWARGFCGVQLVKFLERRRRRQQLEYGLDPDRCGRGAPVHEDAHDLHDALARLDARTLEVVQLKVLEERTFDEIGAQLAISPNTAKSLHYRALARLRSSLQRMLDAEHGTA